MNRTILIIFIIFFNSCSNLKNNINNDLRKIELKENIVQNIIDYKKKYGTESIILISFKNKINSENNTFFINRITNLSTIYRYYISYYMLLDGIPVVISSKKDGLTLPENYSNEFTSLISEKLNNDLLLNSIKKNDNEWEIEYANNLIIDHSETWRIHKNNILKKWHKHPSDMKLLIENNNFDIVRAYQVKNGGIDERKFIQ